MEFYFSSTFFIARRTTQNAQLFTQLTCLIIPSLGKKRCAPTREGLFLACVECFRYFPPLLWHLVGIPGVDKRSKVRRNHDSPLKEKILYIILIYDIHRRVERATWTLERCVQKKIKSWRARQHRVQLYPRTWSPPARHDDKIGERRRDLSATLLHGNWARWYGLGATVKRVAQSWWELDATSTRTRPFVIVCMCVYACYRPGGGTCAHGDSASRTAAPRERELLRHNHGQLASQRCQRCHL